MSDFARMDFFFFVTTVVVIVVGILIALILFRIWRILGHVEKISHEVSEESALLRVDVAQMRENIRREGFKLTHLTRFFRSVVAHFGGKKKRE